MYILLQYFINSTSDYRVPKNVESFHLNKKMIWIVVITKLPQRFVETCIPYFNAVYFDAVYSFGGDASIKIYLLLTTQILQMALVHQYY